MWPCTYSLSFKVQGPVWGLVAFYKKIYKGNFVRKLVWFPILQQNKGAFQSKILYFNSLKTKGKIFYLKTQFVPRSKHFSSRL
jgi:hypothetical protein